MSLKEQAIRNYLSNIDWKRDSWSYNQVEENMRAFLGERPSLDIVYKKDVIVNEVLGETKEIQRIEEITVVFTDTNDMIKKIKILID
jgi:hypothetical protein